MYLNQDNKIKIDHAKDWSDCRLVKTFIQKKFVVLVEKELQRMFLTELNKLYSLTNYLKLFHESTLEFTIYNYDSDNKHLLSNSISSKSEDKVDADESFISSKQFLSEVTIRNNNTLKSSVNMITSIQRVNSLKYLATQPFLKIFDSDDELKNLKNFLCKDFKEKLEGLQSNHFCLSLVDLKKDFKWIIFSCLHNMKNCYFNAFSIDIINKYTSIYESVLNNTITIILNIIKLEFEYFLIIFPKYFSF